MRTFLLFTLVALLGGCGSDSSSNDFSHDPIVKNELGSLLVARVEEHPLATPLSEGENKRKEIPEEDIVFDVTQSIDLRSADPSLLSQFSYYPGHIISSRILGSKIAFSRDACLRDCEKVARCGAVTMISTGGICLFHGPTQPSDQLSPSTPPSKKDSAVFDTYIFDSRSQPRIPNDTFLFWRMTERDGSRDPLTFRLLFTDGTASEWFTLPPMTQGDSTTGAFFEYRGNVHTQNKALEGVIVSIAGSDGVSVGSLAFAGVDDFGSTQPVLHTPMISWNFDDKVVRFDTDCDASILDQCTTTAAFPANPSYVNVYSDSASLSLEEVQTFTDQMVW